MSSAAFAHRSAVASRPSSTPRRGGASRFSRPAPPPKSAPAEEKILFQKFFKSVGPRTYAAQLKQAKNDNQYLVLTEGRRDEKTGELRKSRLFLFSEDFVAFFRMLQETTQFIKAHPVPDEIRRRRQRYWAKRAERSSPTD